VSLTRRVIVGTCGSPGSIRALRYARDLAVSSEAMLFPVHAWLPPGGDLADRRAPNLILRRVWLDSAWKRLWDSVDAAFGGQPEGVAMSPVVVRGAPGEVLVSLASRSDDLLVVGAGSRGRWGGLARLGHGRVGRYCLAYASCPVVAVPPSELARYAGRLAGPRRLRHHGLSADGALDDADRNQG
jgi:nucleotide-binding universal stress UspA family protein